jgi:prepilin-type N-terminal cleavage/methylation domain-containing protein
MVAQHLVDSRAWPGHDARQTNRPGMTLVELAVVVTVVGVVAGFAAPYASSAQFQSDAAARKVHTTLMAAERLAIARQHDVVVSFDTVGHTVRTLEDGDGDGKVDLGERVTWQPLGDNVYFAAPPSALPGSTRATVSGAALRALDGMPSVTFKRNGAASTNVEVYVAAGSRGRPFYRAVAVTQATGRPEWFRWLGDHWKDASL